MGRVKFPVAVHLLLIRSNDDNEKEILLLRRFNTGYEDGNYSVIAGHLDGGEDVYTAMIREATEEAGLNLVRECLEIVQVMHRKSKYEERVDYFFVCDHDSIRNEEVENREPDKCDELKWCAIHRLPPNTVDYIRAAVGNYIDGVRFSLFGW